MTQQEFLLVAATAPNQVNIWVTETEPHVVQGLTVPVYDLDAAYVETYLQQLDQIILPVDETVTVTLNILQASIQNSAGYTYYFFTVENQTVSTIGDNRVPTGSVILIPGVEAAAFNQSPYNVLQGNAETAQQSQYIYQANSNTRAFIQDSLYADTGWTNARYEGTKTSKVNYRTIEAAVLGSAFEGIYYVPSLTDSQVLSQSINNPIYTNYLHTGAESLPTYTVSEIPSAILQSILTPTGSITVVTSQSFSVNTPQLVVGDLVKIDKDATIGGLFSNEVLKITNIQPYTLNPTFNQITYTRGWSNTQIYTGSYTSPAGVYRIEPVRIYELTGNKLQSVARGKVQVRLTSDIAYTDPLGFVYTGSFS